MDENGQFMVVNFRKKGRGRSELIRNLQCLYPAVKIISAAKCQYLTDLLKLCAASITSTFHIPHERRHNSGPEDADDIFDHDSEL